MYTVDAYKDPVQTFKDVMTNLWYLKDPNPY